MRSQEIYDCCDLMPRLKTGGPRPELWNSQVSMTARAMKEAYWFLLLVKHPT